jgi:VWFA-related protein
LDKKLGEMGCPTPRPSVRILFLAAVLASAQDDPTFRSDVRLVQLGVIASDKQGKPGADLRRDEFQVLEDGAPQSVRLFLATTGAVVETPASRPADVYTNQDAIKARTDSRTGYSVILIDNLNTDFGDPFREDGSGWARLETLKMLRSIPEGEKIAIYSIRWTLQVICEFTGDRKRLEEQLNRWAPSPDTPAAGALDPDVPPPPPGLSGNLALQVSSIDGQLRVDAINREIDQLSAYLGGIPGRKNVIWLANRFAADPRRLARLARANVAIYPVDPAGVKSPSERRRQMDCIAQMSGGLAFYGRNDLHVAIREAIDDGRVSYTLGYYRQTEDKGRNTPYSLAVRVTRPGVTLRYRPQESSQDTKDTPPEPASPSKGKAAALVKVLGDPLDAIAVPVSARVKADNGMIDVAAVLEVASLDLQQLQGRWRGNLEVVARFTTADGKTAGETSSRTVVLNLKPATYESARRDGLQYHDRFKIPAKAVEMRLMFGNVQTNKAGSITVPIPAGAAVESAPKKVAKKK